MRKKINTKDKIGSFKKKWIRECVESNAKDYYGRYCEPQVTSFNTVVVAADARYYLGLMKIAEFEDEEDKLVYEDSYWVEEEDEDFLVTTTKCFVVRKVRGQKPTVKFHDDAKRVRVGQDIFEQIE